MDVVVTGSSGKIGRAAMRALREAGHRPVGFDIEPGSDEFRTVSVNCADFGQVMGALAGVDPRAKIPHAVVHLAGIPAPGRAPDHTIFDNNTVATHNVFTACRRLGIKKIVWASSETILGLPFSIPPEFLPIDETHPDLPNYHYALSKQRGETMADTFVRWDRECSIVSLRFSNVYVYEDYRRLPDIHASPSTRKANLWGYVDSNDAGDACRLAVEAPTQGHERMIIAAADTLVNVPSAELRETYLPDVRLTKPLAGFRSLLSTARADEVIGYVPKVSWRDRADAPAWP